VQIDQADGKTLGVNGTPTFFVNGKMLQELGYEQLRALVADATGGRG
jgi:protein-disulfide isomerase